MAEVQDIIRRDIGKFDRATLGLTIIPRAQQSLMPGDEPLRAASGQLAGNRKFALVLLTDERLFNRSRRAHHGDRGSPARADHLRVDELDEIDDLDGREQEVDIRAVSRPAEVASAIRQAVAAPRTGGQPAQWSGAEPPNRDVYDQLRKLGELRDAGVITPEEFAEKKTKLLGQI